MIFKDSQATFLYDYDDDGDDDDDYYDDDNDFWENSGNLLVLAIAAPSEAPLPTVHHLKNNIKRMIIKFLTKM